MKRKISNQKSKRTTKPFRKSLPKPMQVPKGEIKTVDINPTSNNFRLVATPPTGNLLNGLQTGAGYFNRIGSKIRMKSIQLRGVITQSATAVEGYLRMLIVYDKQSNGTLPDLVDIIESRNNAGTALTTIYSQAKTENRERFEIIRDKVWRNPSATFTGGVQTNGPSYPGVDDSWEFNEFIKLNSKKVSYKNSTGGISDITTGSLMVFFFCAGTDSAWTCNWSSRLRFYDN